MSVYNDERYLEEAVRSVLGQSCGDLELICVNDGSTDRSREILGSCGYKRLRVINQENTGLTVALNRAGALARGEWLARQDADDRSLPQRFEKQLAFLEHTDGAVAAGSDWEIIDENGLVQGQYHPFTRDAWLRATFPLGNRFGHGPMMFGRQAFQEVGGYDSRYRYTQDYDLWWRLALMGKVYNLPEVLYQHRHHGGAVSTVRAAEQRDFADRIRLNVLREWLVRPEGFERVRRMELFSDPVIDARADEFSGLRAERFRRNLGQLGVAMSLIGRPREARWALGAAVKMTGPLCRESLLWLGIRLGPGLVRGVLARRCRDLELYRLCLKADFTGRGEGT